MKVTPRKIWTLWVITLSWALCTGAAHAEIPASGCFDFSAPPAPLQNAERSRTEDAGRLDSGSVWAKQEKLLDRPIGDILSDLEKHQLTKSSKVDEMTIQSSPDPRSIARQTIEFKVHPFLFVVVEWKEDWVFRVLKGNSADPLQIWVGYQKTEGTSHIDHLCGSYILTRKSPNQTDVSLIEEVKASRRSLEDTQKGVASTLDRLGRGK